MTKITDRSLEILSGLMALQWLEFWEIAGITDDGLTALAGLPGLRDVLIGGCSQVKGLGLLPQGNGRFDVRGARNGDCYGDGGHERHEYGSGSERTRI